jgi:hypothetical protein
MNLRRTDRRGAEKTNYESHIARVKQAKTLVDCQAPDPHPIANKVAIEKVLTNLPSLMSILHRRLILMASIVLTKILEEETCTYRIREQTSSRENCIHRSDEDY